MTADERVVIAHSVGLIAQDVLVSMLTWSPETCDISCSKGSPISPRSLPSIFPIQETRTLSASLRHCDSLKPKTD
jgi:hypothetical protein